MKLVAMAAALVAVAAAAGPARAQDAAAGEDSFRKCRACHTVGPGARNLVGPVLNGLEGRKAGTIEGFTNYSDANKNSGIVWNEAEFVKYIANPALAMPGNRMGYPGIGNEKERHDLWAFLAQFKADGSKK